MMRDKVVYVTSGCPYGYGEVWGIREIASLKEAGADVVVVPRSLHRKKVVYAHAQTIIADTMAISLLDFRAILYFIFRTLTAPVRVYKLFRWIFGYADNVSWFIKALAVMPKSIFIAHRLKNENITHIHAFSSTSVSVVAYILSSELAIPWSITFHSSWKIDDKRRSITAQCESVKFVRAISSEVWTTLDRFTNSAYSDKLKVVHIGVKCITSTPPSWMPNYKIFQICSVGGLNTWKGIDISLAAIKEMLDRGFTDFQWTFYGNGPLQEELKALVIELGITKYVVFAGAADNASILSKYKNKEIDLYVQNSIVRDGVYEGIPVSIMEAMAYGIAVIASDCGGTRELVGPKSGTLIAQGNPVETAKQIIRHLSDDCYREAQGIRALEKIQQDFDTMQIAKELLQYFK